MLKDKNFVKRLASCEIMGGANNICSDKTGTLTMNKMHVTNIWHGKDSELPVNQDRPEDNVEEGGAPKDAELPSFAIGDFFSSEKHGQLLIQSLACNTQGEKGNAGATDLAMIELIPRTGVDYLQVRKDHGIEGSFTRFPFTSKRKRMGTIAENITDNEYGYDKRLHVKGAAEIVLGTCSHWMNENGDRDILSEDQKNDIIKNVIEKYASNALRTICLAYKDLKDGDGGPSHEDDAEDGYNKAIEVDNLTCIGILGIKDIIRPEVPGAVEQCEKANVRVRMVTGDNKITAIAIAKECNLVTDIKDYSIMEGPKFFDVTGGLYCKTCNKDSPCECATDKVDEGVKNREVFKQIRQDLCVLARSRPEDKYLLVTGLREFGDVVAVTGDGTNDAPALKKADVGFAMGITGTDVAKGAADIILLDDNFASIVQACMWGRNIYDNIRRFLQFQLTVNVVALISAFLGACILRESPLQPIQLLWVNLIMDSLASLALATEPPKREELLNRPPQGRDDYIISRKMVKHILAMSILQAIVVFGIVFFGEWFIPEAPGYIPNRKGMIYPGRPYSYTGEPLYTLYYGDYGPSRHMSVVFTAFVFMQVFNMINARKINDELNPFSGIFGNSMFIIIWVIIFIVQILLSQFTQDIFKVARAVRNSSYLTHIGSQLASMAHLPWYRMLLTPIRFPH